MSKNITPIRPNSPAVDFSILEKLDDNTSSIDEKIKKCFMYFCHIKEPSKLLIDKRAIYAIKYLNERIKNSETRKEFKLIFKFESIFQIFSNIFSYYINDYKSLINNPDIVDDSSLGDGINGVWKLEYIFFNLLLSFCVSMTNSFKLFVYKLHDCQGTKNILKYLESDLLNKISKDKSKNYMAIEIIECLTILILNLSTIADNRIKDFKDMKVVNLIMEFLVAFKDDYGFSTKAYVILANIVDDDEISNLPDIKLAIKNITKAIESFSQTIATDKNLRRITVDIEIDGESKRVAIYHGLNGWHVYELINCLIRLAVNDKIKQTIYEENNLKKSLELIIYHGNDYEKAFSIKLLSQLSFDVHILQQIYDNEKLFNYIESLRTSTKNDYLKQYCNSITWLINKIDGIVKKKDNSVLDSLHGMRFKEKEIKPGNHIMISYNSESRDLCLKIKKELEKNNYNVWIDVEKIHGSSLESMGVAVEDSQCVLVCVTEKYKQSPNCRLEAEYAFKLNKPIIPLVMQTDYAPDGWLGILIGSKIYVNFTKFTFQDAINKLINELKSLIQQSIEGSLKTNIKKQSLTTVNYNHDDQKKSIESWSNEDVKKWIKEKNIDNRIGDLLKNFNGHQLIRLKSIWREAPDFFYKSISQNNIIDLLAVVNFSEEFEKL